TSLAGSKELKDHRSFARVFRKPTWIKVGFGEPPLQRTTATAGKLYNGQAFKPGRRGDRSPEVAADTAAATTKRLAKPDGYNSRGNFADFAVLPNDHRQTHTAKFS